MQSLSDTSGIFFCLLTGNILATLILGIFFKVNYPEDRIAIFFYIFLAGSFLFLIDRGFPSWKFSPLAVVAIPFLFFPVQFLHRINLTYLSFYISDNIPPRFYDKVYKSFTPGNFPPTIGGEKLRHFCWSYLDYSNGGKLSQIFYTDYPGYMTDYLIVTTTKNPKWANFYNSIDYDKYSGRELLLRKNSLQKNCVGNWENITSDGVINSTYFTLFEQKTDQLSGNSLYLTLDISLKSDKKPFVAWIVSTAIDDKGTQYSYEKISLDWLRTEWNGAGNNLKQVMLLPEIPKEATKVVTYLWNVENASYSIRNGSCKLYTIVPDWK
jgi:hypothetical protein